MEKIKIRSSFKLKTSITPLYTGGPVAMSLDEEYLFAASTSDINIIHISSGNTVQETLSLGDESKVSALVAFSSGCLISASASGLLSLWKMEEDIKWKLQRSWKCMQGPILSLACSYNDVLVASGSSDGSIRVWDISGGFCTHNLKGHAGPVTALSFHPSKYELLSGSHDGSVRLWDLTKQQQQNQWSSTTLTPATSTSGICSVSFSRDGNYISAGGKDQILYTWNANKPKKSPKAFPTFEALTVVGFISSDDTQNEDQQLKIFTVGDSGLLRLWNLDGKTISKFQTSSPQILHACFLSKTNRILTVTSDQNIFLRNVSDFSLSQQFVGFNDQISDMAILSNFNDNNQKKYYLAVATNSNQIVVYDLNSFDSFFLEAHAGIVMCLASASFGPFLISGSKDSSIIFWNLSNGNVNFNTLSGHTDSISALAFSSAEGSFFVSSSQDKTIKLWNYTTGKEQGTIKFNTNFTVKAHDKDINAIAISPNDKLIASGSQDKTIKLWDSANGSCLCTLKGHKRGIWSVAFSPVDQVLASSSADNTIKLWNMANYSCLRTFEGHLNSVLRVIFMNHGTQLVSSSSEGLVKVWNIASNDCILSLDNHTDRIWALTLLSNDDNEKDGKPLIASGGADSVINLWEDFTDEQEELAKKKQEEALVQEQSLSNALFHKDYANAILLSISLDQPNRLYNLLYEVVDNGPLELQLRKIISSLPRETSLIKLLHYICNWNTQFKKAYTCQKLLSLIIQEIPLNELVLLPGISEVIRGMVPYTEKHLNRLDDLSTQSYIVDYTLSRMNVLNPAQVKLENDKNK